MKVYKPYYVSLVLGSLMAIVGVFIIWVGLNYDLVGLTQDVSYILVMLGALLSIGFTKTTFDEIRRKDGARYYIKVPEHPRVLNLVTYNNLALIVINNNAYVLSKEQFKRYKLKLENDIGIDAVSYYDKNKEFLRKIYQI